jgi:hypothetical protein
VKFCGRLFLVAWPPICPRFQALIGMKQPKSRNPTMKEKWLPCVVEKEKSGGKSAIVDKLLL